MNKLTSPDHTRRPPFPQTLESAGDWFRHNGVSKTQWAAHHQVSRLAVEDILRGRLSGRRGEAHRAAILLGLKADPEKTEDQQPAPILATHKEPNTADAEAYRLFALLIYDEENNGPLIQRLRKMMREEAAAAIREHEAQRAQAAAEEVANA